MIRLPLDDRDRIDLGKPILTLDVNQVAIKAPDDRALEYQHLAYIEFNYFETGLVEAAVTPETAFEISAGVPPAALGSTAYQRFQKSEWFKARPSGTTLSLNEQDSNELWVDVRWKLWPTVGETMLTTNQRADVSQLFFHSVSSGIAVCNSAFITTDHHFLDRRDVLRQSYGVQVMTNEEAWKTYAPQFGLITPAPADVRRLWEDQNELSRKLRTSTK